MSYTITKGATSQSIELYIVDSTDGTPETGVLWNTAGIDLKYRRKDAVVVSITEAALTTPLLTDTWETGGFLEIGNGVYRLDLPNAALTSAAGIDRVVVFGTVTGMVVLPVTIHLTAFDLATATQDVNATQISGDTTAADNLELFTEVLETGTGLIDSGTFKAGAITAAAIADAAIDNATFAADVGSTAYATNIIALAADKAGLNGVNVIQLVGVAQSATDLKDFADAGYDPGTNKVTGVLLTDTVTTYTGNTKQTANNNTLLTTIDGKVDTAQTDLDTITGTGGALIGTDVMDRSATLDVNTKTITNGIIVAATLGADCITNAKIADDAIAAENLATGAIAADAVAATALDNVVMSDLAQGAPSVTASLPVALNWLYEAFRNKTETTATRITIYKDDTATELARSTISDNATTFTKGEMATGV